MEIQINLTVAILAFYPGHACVFLSKTTTLQTTFTNLLHNNQFAMLSMVTQSVAHLRGQQPDEILLNLKSATDMDNIICGLTYSSGELGFTAEWERLYEQVLSLSQSQIY